MRLLAEAGLTTREACGHSIRNITACPLAGVDAAQVFDVTPYADALTRHLLRGPLSSTLPRKFKVAFEGCHRGCVRAPINDLAFVARRDDAGRPGFLVLVGGGTSTLARSGGALTPFLPAGDLLGLAEAVVRVFHREGDRTNKHKARLKWVIERLGFPAFQALVLAEWEAMQAAGGAPALPFDPQDPPVEPVPARPHLALQAADPPEEPIFAAWRRSNVVPQVQPGLHAAVVTLPLGDISAAQLLRLAALCEELSDGSVRTTADQNLVLRHVPAWALPRLHRRLAEAGLGQPGAGDLGDVVSCPGADTCNIAVTASRGMGRLLREHLLAHPPAEEGAGLGGARIHISGCPNGCGQHHIAAIGLQGGLRKIGGRPLPVYHVLVGGGLTDDTTGGRFGRLVGKLPARRGPEAVERLIDLWRRERQDGDEPLGAFLHRVPLPRLRQLLADLFEIDEAAATAADYIDLGQEAPFTVGQGEAECAA
jgi:sulfite reductase (NADPH) hemoprotein beta-component